MGEILKNKKIFPQKKKKIFPQILKNKKIFYKNTAMITFSKYSSALITGAKRILKIKQFGVKTAKECGPFGFDSVPFEGMTAIYAETSNKDEAVVIGYINIGQFVAAGESRMYSVDSSGQLLGYVYNRNDGKLGLNGFDYSAVRFLPLDQAIQAQNVLINAELAKIAASIASLGGSYIVAPVSTNLAPAESPTVKIK